MHTKGNGREITRAESLSRGRNVETNSTNKKVLQLATSAVNLTLHIRFDALVLHLKIN